MISIPFPSANLYDIKTQPSHDTKPSRNKIRMDKGWYTLFIRRGTDINPTPINRLITHPRTPLSKIIPMIHFTSRSSIPVPMTIAIPVPIVTATAIAIPPLTRLTPFFLHRPSRLLRDPFNMQIQSILRSHGNKTILFDFPSLDFFEFKGSD